MSVLNQNSDDEPLECPLCMEYLELDDVNFYPCSCGYQICRFCWNKIRTEGNGNCPACRSAYAENPADFKPLTAEEMAKIKAEKRQKDQAKKQKISENRKHLANVRVVQKNLVFVVGLSPRLADAEVLRKPEYFGKFGKMHKVVINLSTAYAGNQNQGPSASAYVTYLKSEDALRAIQAVSNIFIDGRTLKASLGTTKYCSHFMKNQPCPKPDCMYLHELGDEAASFTKEEMQQGKHTEYEKHLHEEMLLNQSTAPSDSPNQQSSESITNQKLQLLPEKQVSQNNGPLISQPQNSKSPITVGVVDICTTLDSGGSRSEATGILPTNSTSMVNGSDFKHTANNTGQGGIAMNKDVIDTKIHIQHHHNSSNNREQHAKGILSGTIHKNNSNSHCNTIVSSRTPSPKGTVQNGHIDRVGGAVSSTATGMSSTSCGSVGSTTSSSSSGSSNTSINSSGGSGVGLWQNLDRGNNSARKWNDSPDSLRDCNSQPNNELDSQQAIANSIQSSNSTSNEAGELYRSNQSMLSNINSSRNRGDGNLGISEQTSSYFTNNIDNLQLDQQQQINCTNGSSVSNSKGWPSSEVQQTVDSKDDLYAEDDLGFDPFHETQKALAEMLESESKLQDIYTSSQSPQSFSLNQTSQQHTMGNVNHQVSGPSLQQSSSLNSIGSGMPNLPPGLPSFSSAATTSVMNNGRLPLKQPPPGFGHQSLLSQDSHSFGIGTHQNGGGLGDVSNFQTAMNQHPFGGQQNDFLGVNGFSNPSRSGLRNISGGGANGSLNFPPHSNNHVQSMQQQMNHTNHQHISDHPAHRQTQQSSTSSSGNISNVDHLQQQLRQLSFEKHNLHQSKNWEEGLRALLPNVNVSFGALPNNGSGFSGNNTLNSNQSGHSHIDLEARFNHSLHQSGSMSSNSANNHLLNDHSPHNLINSLQQTGQSTSHQTQGNHHPNHMNHLNHHAQHQQQHMNLQQQQHNERPQMQQQHRSHTGWGNMSANDWTNLDPAIVSGQLSDHNLPQNNGTMGHGVNGAVHGSRSDSPPHWIKANL